MCCVIIFITTYQLEPSLQTNTFSFGKWMSKLKVVNYTSFIIQIQPSFEMTNGKLTERSVLNQGDYFEKNVSLIANFHLDKYSSSPESFWKHLKIPGLWFYN